MPAPHALDTIARGLAQGMSRREALRKGGAAFAAAVAMSPADAWAKATGTCPHHRVRCHGTCCPAGEVCIHPRHGKPHCGCPRGTTRCRGKCVHTKTDAHNCGKCGHRCPTGEACHNGKCVCGPGKVNCGGKCVELTADPHNCGACGHACAAGMVCSRGTCAQTCPEGTTNCGGGCVTVADDPNHCGTCGHICAAGTVCASGTCVTKCPAGTVNCSGACVTTATDPANCGACGQVCTGALACYKGTCTTCPSGTANCGGRCINTSTDPANCGACGHSCAPGQYCNGGTCSQCPAGSVVCAGGCCQGNACCSGDTCQTVHDNGVGGHYYNCGHAGTPGNAATYTEAMAREAAASFSSGPASVASCPGGVGEIILVRAPNNGAYATWGYTGKIAGHANIASGGPVCPTPTTPVWT